MSGMIKVLTGILGVLAVAACFATIGIIGYSIMDGGNGKKPASENEIQAAASPSQVPTAAPEQSVTPEAVETPRPVVQTQNLEGHIHDYKETVEEKATCYKSGRIKYECECGDYYYTDVPSTGHVADDWETVRKPSADREGLRVKKCIYCDEILAQENIPWEKTDSSGGNGDDASGNPDNESESQTSHIHQYTATVEREPTCTFAGLRKHTCSCGNFYTEMIPAAGHVASDWTVAEAPTSTMMGREQRVCNVCGVILDSRPLNVVQGSPSASASAASSASAAASASARASASASASARASASASAASSASPTATHVHNYRSYVIKEANCQEIGIRSFVCSCGSTYGEEIPKDSNRHTYHGVVIPATRATQGYTIYTCVRCNYSYVDNYTPALGV